jgi:hypothetical protein
MSDHVRNTGPMLASPRCGAKIRCCGSCRAPAVRCKRRCRMHGGAPGSGAPGGNQNARRHGRFTGEVIAERKQIGALLGEARSFLAGVNPIGTNRSKLQRPHQKAVEDQDAANDEAGKDHSDGS